MSTLQNLLKCLEREDIVEVCLQSNQVVQAKSVKGSVAPLTKVALSTAHIARIVDGTNISGMLTEINDHNPHFGTQIDVSGKLYDVHATHAQQILTLKFVRHQSGPSIAPAPIVENETISTISKPPIAISIDKNQSKSPESYDIQQVATKNKRTPDPEAKSHLDEILLAAQQHSVSDIHLSSGSKLRVRTNAELLAQGNIYPIEHVNRLLNAILDEQSAMRLEKHGYADFSLNLPKSGRFRVNVNKQSSGLKGCFRVIPKQVPTLTELMLPKEVEHVAHFHQGLAIISGPNRQGKSTTLAAIVDHINTTSHHHIITVEDPVEFIHPQKKSLMSQREVGGNTQSFSRALKAALREDPDVIVIGELRDRETVEIALNAAETGHLVIATMSTRSASKTIDRLIDLFPPEEQTQVRATLAGALKMIISQKLIPGVDGNLIAAAELITGSVPLWSLIRDNKLFQLPSLQQRGRSLGMIKLDTSLLDLLDDKKISLDTAKKFAENFPEMERLLQSGSYKRGL